MSSVGCYSKESLESQVQALTGLIEVARAVVSTIDLDRVLRTILTSAMDFAGTPAGTLAAYDEKNKEFVLHSCEGLSVDFAGKKHWDVMPGGLTEQVLAAVDIFFIEDVEQATYLNSPVELAEGIKSLICVPLRLQEEVVGILHLGDFVPRQFDREKMKLLSVFSSFASMAIYNAKIHSNTRIMAISDGLTGLHNHRYFQQIFSQEMRRAKRYRKSLGILMIDVDDFKRFNDKYGHPVGDRVLMAIGKIITKNLRKVDFAFRYGGEEFIVLLPEAALESALLAAERLRGAIGRETVEMLKGETAEGVTVSVGVACFPEDGADRVTLFKVVDELLYKAKRFGKNKVYSMEKNSGTSDTD
ncbi:MAG TPA: sensor domain-containing diguanylate cyclase [Geobacteraceae bacterium]|nr:sensor domain-containing diguanylate cyclase [Geobacteraceae bacterium]